MQVKINGILHDYYSDFDLNSTKWKVKLKDAFCIEVIGGISCFIKRFTDEPQAYGLLSRLKNIGNSEAPSKTLFMSMPRIYDIVDVIENGKIVYYLFQHCIAGETLKEHLLKEKVYDTRRLATDVLNGLKFIHAENYWFSDFNEENIFCSDSNEYLLIDVDSCLPASVKPGADIAKPGGMPGAAQEYANVVLKIFREYVKGQANFLYEDIDGRNLNCLQLMAFTSKLEYYSEIKKLKPKTPYINKKAYSQLHDFLFNANAQYCLVLFTMALGDYKRFQYRAVETYIDFITGKTIVNNDKLPVIESFKASGQDIYKGGQVKLTWMVKNADELYLTTGNGVQHNVTGKTFFDDMPQKNETYTLSAVKTARTVSETLLVKVTTIPEPQIIALTSDKASVKKGEKVTLSWSVANASKLTLNGVTVNTEISQTTITVDKSTSYTLIAENRVGQKVTRAVNVKATSYRWALWALMIFILILVWQVITYTTYRSALNNAKTALEAQRYDDAVRLFEAAKTKGYFSLISGTVNRDINDAYYQKYKIDGEAALKAGNITSVKYGTELSALNYFTKALSFNRDSFITGRIAFCNQIKNAEGSEEKYLFNKASNQYQLAAEYGAKIAIPDQCLEKIRALHTQTSSRQAHVVNSTFDTTAYKNGNKGLEIKFTLYVSNCKDESTRVVVNFYHADGSSITSADPEYSVNGQLAINQYITPIFADTCFKDITVFIPFSKPKFYFPVHVQFNISVFNGDFKIGGAANKNGLLWPATSIFK